jgi:hypothetical protein
LAIKFQGHAYKITPSGVLTTTDNTMGAKDEDRAYSLEAYDDDILEGMDAFEATKLLHTPGKSILHYIKYRR